MNSIEKQPVPIGGSRVPDSMGGSSATPWQELPEQLPQTAGGYGEACDAVLALREQIASLKKQLSGLAVPMKDYIYTLTPTGRAALEEALSQTEAAAAAIDAAAAAAAELAAKDSCLDTATKAEAAKLLTAVAQEATQQAAESRSLCESTAEKKDKAAAAKEVEKKEELNKELYGDFNLQLGPITRKIFAVQTKLLALVKNMKKQRSAAEPN
ncbi:hypothetical protein Efla_005799 [Eimeria flavescens]